MSRHTAIPIDEASQIGDARRIAVRHAELAGLDSTESGKVAIIATEMATNLVRHATKGQLLLQVMDTGGTKSVELISVDCGPGIADVSRCLEDGYSTSGTSGTGLGAIKRLSSEFDIHTVQPAGTVILSRVSSTSAHQSPNTPFRIGATSIAMHGETVCGDTWKSSQDEHSFRLMVADGLGHGPLAENAAQAADGVFDAHPAAEPGILLGAAHRALMGTRGAALAVASLNLQTSELKYAGIGNIAGVLITPTGYQGLISHNGIVGSQRPRIQEFGYSCSGAGLLIMHSDGLKTRWSLDDHPGLALRHPAVIAAVLYRDYCRGRDDATVAVVTFR